MSEIKQETLEKLANDFYPNENELMERIAFKRGYTECKEKMYSEEEVHSVIESYQNNIENNPNHITYDKWFEQFKKK